METRRRSWKAALVAAAACVLAMSVVPAWATDAPTAAPTAASPLDLNDDEIEWRLAFITDRLQGSKRHAAIWNVAWTVVNAGALGWMTYEAVDDGDTDDRGRAITEASKSFIGLIDLYWLRPMKARYGAEAIASMPTGTRTQRLAKLKKAEQILEQNAQRADDRYTWPVHLGNVVLNFAGAGAIWATGGGTGEALTSAFAGIAGGELMFWTEPGQPRTDFAEYKDLTGGTTFSEVPRAWHLVAIPGGLAVAREF